jgi:hypothetical protein
MATKRKTGTVAKATKTVKRAAHSVAKAADDYVVEPVEKALGMKGKKRPARTKTAAHKKASTGRAAKTTAKKGHSTKRASKAKSR